MSESQQGDAARPEAAGPDKAPSERKRRTITFEAWQKRCRARWPIHGMEQEERLHREVLEPARQKRIRPSEAEKRWQAISEQAPAAGEEPAAEEPAKVLNAPAGREAAEQHPELIDPTAPTVPLTGATAAIPAMDAQAEPAGGEQQAEDERPAPEQAAAMDAAQEPAGAEPPPDDATEAATPAAAAAPTASEEPPQPPQETEAAQATADQAVAGTAEPELEEGGLEPPPKPEWKVLEPEDRTDPVEHEVCTLKRRDRNWHILAASVRGKLHAHHAKWREDAFAFDWVDNWTMIAVCDGAGSARFSRIGARLASGAAVAALKEMLSGYDIHDKRGDAPSSTTLKQLKAFLVLAACEARDAVVREAFDREVSEKELYATLLLLIHTPWRKKDLVGAIQVGDGAIGVYTADGTSTLLGTADHGEWSSETVFLTSWKELAKRPFDHRVLFSVKENVKCIAAMCDGVSDDFFPEEKRLIELFQGDPIQEIAARDGGPVRGVLHEVVKQPGQDGEVLKDWLRYEKRGSSDDRTLVLMYRSDA